MRVKVNTKTSRSEVNIRLFKRYKEVSMASVDIKRATAHIIRVESLSVCRVLQEHPLESEDFADSAFGQRCEVVGLKLVHLIVAYNFFQDSVELVQYFDPGVQVRSGPLPSGDVA